VEVVLGHLAFVADASLEVRATSDCFAWDASHGQEEGFGKDAADENLVHLVEGAWRPGRCPCTSLLQLVAFVQLCAASPSDHIWLFGHHGLK
jgi:hypothetical protein